MHIIGSSFFKGGSLRVVFVYKAESSSEPFAPPMWKCQDATNIKIFSDTVLFFDQPNKKIWDSAINYLVGGMSVVPVYTLVSNDGKNFSNFSAFLVVKSAFCGKINDSMREPIMDDFNDTMSLESLFLDEDEFELFPKKRPHMISKI